MDSESEEENETLPTAGEKETVNKEIVNDLSEAWMIDGVGTINSDSEKEKEFSPRHVASSSNTNIIGKTKNEGSTETKVCSSNMNTNKKEIPVDDVGTINLDSEEEKEISPRLVAFSSNTNIIGKTKNEGSTETKVCSSNMNTSKKEIHEATDLSEDWMIDDVKKIMNHHQKIKPLQEKKIFLKINKRSKKTQYLTFQRLG